MEHKSSLHQDRRQFLRLLTGGSLLCLGCGHLCAVPAAQKVPSAVRKDKFQDDAKMTMAGVFDFTYNEISMKVKLLADIMAEDIGREKFLAYLKEAGKRSGRIDAAKYKKKLGRDDLKAFTSELREPDYMVNHILTYDIIKDTDTIFEVRIKECLWAKTFRKNDAADIGFAMFCNRDYTTATAFNPKIRLVRDKTLMQGYNHCNHRWVYQGS